MVPLNTTSMAVRPVKTRTASISPQHCFHYILQHYSHPVLLESARPHSQYGRYSVITAQPIASLKQHQGVITGSLRQKPYVGEGDYLEQLQGLLEETCFTSEALGLCHPERSRRAQDHETPPYFTGGALGYLSYDFGKSLWPQHQVGQWSDWPEACFFIYDWSLVYDHQEEIYCLHGNAPEGLESLLFEQELPPLNPIQTPDSAAFQFGITQERYFEAIEQIHQWIREGDHYQMNFTYPIHSRTSLDAWSLYRLLTQYNAAPFAAYFPLSIQHTVLSASPELFFRLRGRQALMRPIKGTITRHMDPIQDQAAQQQLWQSEKDRAELLMIIDLERNDLGRVCEFGSVTVPEIYTLESYATVHHLVSSIEGTLREDCNVFDLIRAAFPCGSITGAPKLRAMERIQQLEGHSRGVYTGSLGWIDFAGNADFNVCIRTLMMNENQLTFAVGGGITIESHAEAEYAETLHKGQGLALALGGTLV